MVGWREGKHDRELKAHNKDKFLLIYKPEMFYSFYDINKKARVCFFWGNLEKIYFEEMNFPSLLEMSKTKNGINEDPEILKDYALCNYFF